jgi:hypothetical protein
MVESTTAQIEAGQFPPHSVICFPMNGCTSCSRTWDCVSRTNN